MARPAPTLHRKRHQARGFTLVELACVLAVLAVLAGLVLPGYQGHVAQARRADAVAALTQLQAAQEQYRSHHGLYADSLAVLAGVPQGRSAQGHYTLALQRTEGEAYVATATARADSAQASDHACPALSLEVRAGFARPGPDPRCWNR